MNDNEDDGETDIAQSASIKSNLVNNLGATAFR